MDTPKVLAQSYPAASTLTDAFTASVPVVVSTIKVCNQNEVDATFRVSVAVDGAADEAKQYVYYDVPLEANDTFSATEGWTLGAGDVIRVRSDSGRCSFNLFGAEVS